MSESESSFTENPNQLESEARIDSEILRPTEFGPEDMADGETDREAQKSRAKRLRDSPEMQALFAIIQGDPSLREAIRVVTARSSEFKEDVVMEFLDTDFSKSDDFYYEGSREFERFRNFTSLFAAMRLNNRTAEILDLAEKRAFKRDRQAILERIKRGDNYVPELIIGTGAAAANYLSTRKEFIPGQPSLAISREFGGEFSIAEEGIWDANSRNRPVSRKLRPTPGTPGSLNEIGKYAVAQPSDYGNEAYQSQDEIGDAIRDNLMVIGNAIRGVELVSLKKSSREGIAVEALIRDLETGEQYTVFTDRVVDLGGTGIAKYGLDISDGETADILFKEGEKLDSDEKPKVVTFNPWAKRVGSKSNDFPLRDYKNPIVIGDRDGMFVVWGQLKGYEPQRGKSVRQIDNIESVTLVGKDAPVSREEFLSKSRPRYAVVGNELPRESDPDYYFTTTGKKGIAKRLRRSGENIIVECEDENGEIFTVEGDGVILTTGFEVDPTAYETLNNETIRDKDEIQRRARDIVEHRGSVIYYKKGGNRVSLEIIDTFQSEAGRVLKFKETFRDGREQESELTIDPIDTIIEGTPNLQWEMFKKMNLDPKRINRVEYVGGFPPPERPVYGPDDPNDPIAVQVGDLPVYKAGAAARLPLPERIKNSAAKIPENSASFFVSSEGVTKLARMFSLEDRFTERKFKSLLPETTRPEPVFLSQRERLQEAFLFDLLSKGTELPTDIVPEDILKELIGSKLYHYRFATTDQALALSVSQTQTKDGSRKFSVTAYPGAYIIDGDRTIVEELMEDRDMQALLARLTDKKNNISQTITINIPLEPKPKRSGDGKVDIPYKTVNIRDIYYSVERKK